MVAPLNSKASFEAEGESITLRLNMATIDLANEHAIDLIYGGFGTLNSSQMATLVTCLASGDHPGMTRSDALVYVTQHGPALGAALTALLLVAAGAPDELLEGNATKPGEQAPAETESA